MEAQAVFGRASPPCLSSSLLSSQTQRTSCSLSYTHCPIQRTKHHLHLAAFRSKSHLFSYSPSRPHAKTLSHKTHIFLPHLVASMEQVEETYIMVKPDAVQRWRDYFRFEKKGFKLTGLKIFECPKELAEEHYKDLKSKSFFPKLIDYITSGPVVCMAWEGVGVVASAQKLIGSTDPLQADPGTIRGDLAVQTGRNVVHGSDSPENGKREIAPEYTSTMVASLKGDAYGFGAVLLELVIGQKPLEVSNVEDGFKGKLVDWVNQLCSSGQIKDAISPLCGRKYTMFWFY